MFWKRNKPTDNAEPVKHKCDHKWKDFDWYMDFTIEGKALKYKICEPYVCIHCKLRKDIVLEQYTIWASSNASAWEQVEELRQKYPKIKGRAIIEDEINDTQLIDREYLKYATMFMGVKF